MPETDTEITKSESTAVDSEIVPIKGQVNIKSISHRIVNEDLIDQFNLIPDAIEQSRMPFPVIVQAGNRFTCLEGNHLVMPGTPAQCIVIEADDTSDTALATLKVSLWMTGLLFGKLTYMEQIRDIRIIFNLHADDAGLIINGNGGDRKSEEFKEQHGEHIRLFIARTLDRSEATIRIALDHTRYLNLKVMNELARLKATKRFMLVACQRRTQLLSQLSENLTEEEKKNIVSKKFLEWFLLYNPTTGEIESEKKDHEKEQVEKGNQAPEKTDLDTKSDTPAVSPEQKQEKILNNISDQSTSPSSAAEPGNNDLKKSKVDDNQEDDLEEDDAQNDINIGGTPSLPDVSLQSSTKETGSDIYKQLEDIGNSLIKISQDKPAQELLSEQVGGIIRQLIRLFPKAQVTSISLSSTTLSGGKVWENSYPFVAVRA